MFSFVPHVPGFKVAAVQQTFAGDLVLPGAEPLAADVSAAGTGITTGGMVTGATTPATPALLASARSGSAFDRFPLPQAPDKSTQDIVRLLLKTLCLISCSLSLDVVRLDLHLKVR